MVSLQDLLGGVKNTVSQVKEAAQVYKKVQEQKPLTEKEKKVAQTLANVTKVTQKVNQRASGELKEATPETKMNMQGLTGQKILEQMKLQESALEKKGLIPKKTTQQKLSDFMVTPTYDGGSWADRINLGGLKGTPIVGGAIQGLELAGKAGAAGLQSILGSVQAGAQGLQKTAESLDSRKTWQERAAGMLGGGLETATSLGFAVPSAGFAAAGELPVAKTLIKDVMEPALGKVHGVISFGMDKLASVTPQAYRPFVKDLAEPVANLAADLFLLKKAGQAGSKMVRGGIALKDAYKIAKNPEYAVDVMIKMNPNNPMLQAAKTNPELKANITDFLTSSIRETQGIYDISFGESRLAYKTGKKDAKPGLTEPAPLLEAPKAQVGVEALLSATEKIVPATSKLKALESAIRQEIKGQEPKVKTKLYNVKEQLRKIQNPELVKPTKGRGVMQMLAEGESPADFIKIKKTGSGDIRVSRKEFNDLVEGFTELPRSIFGLGKQRGFLDPSIYTFEKLDPAYKENFYRKVTESNKRSQVEVNDTIKTIETLEKAALKENKKASERVATYLLAQEFRGKEMLELMKKKIPTLTKAEAEYASVLKEYYKSLFDRLNESRRAAGKEPIEHRENYMTRLHDMGYLKQLGYDLGLIGKEQFLPAGAKATTPGVGSAGKQRIDIADFTPKELKQYAKTIRLNSFDSLRSYVGKIVPVIHQTPTFAKLRELANTKITDPATGRTLDLKGTRTGDFLNRWLDKSMGQKSFELPPVLEKPLALLNKNQAFAKLSWNVNSALTQGSAYLQTVTHLGPKWAATGAKDLMMGKGKMAMEKSNVLMNRVFEVAQAEVKGMGGLKKKVGEAGLKPLQILDLLTAQSTWLSAYNKAMAGAVKYKGKKQKMTEKEAINYADDVVTKTQASAAPWDIAPIQNSTLGKTLTMFQTFTINNFKWLKHDVLGMGNKEISKAEVLKRVMTYAIGSSLIDGVYKQAGLPSPIVDWVGEVGQLAEGEQTMEEFLRNVSTVVPIVGGTKYLSSEEKQGNLLEQVFRANQTVQLFGDTQDLLGEVQDMIFGVPKGEEGKEKEKKKNIDKLQTLGNLLGIPGTSQIVKMVKGAAANEDGYEVYYKTPGGKIKKKTLQIEGAAEKLRAILFGPAQTKTVREHYEGW